MAFHVGQKVVFVGSKLDVPSTPDPYKLKRGDVYTIRDFDMRGVDTGVHKYPTVRLVEVKRPINRRCNGTDIIDWEAGYVPDAFRPVHERKADISIFTEMLKPKTRELVCGND